MRSRDAIAANVKYLKTKIKILIIYFHLREHLGIHINQFVFFFSKVPFS